jgi:hypothetical protein
MARFVVDLGEIEMTSEAEAQLADEIQKVALGYVAKADTRGPVAIQFPREWYGIYLRRTFDELQGVEKQLAEFARGGRV